mgnify:CR=1 FL=1
MSWFEDTFGFKETTYDATRERFEFLESEGEGEGFTLKVKDTDKSFHIGKFEMLSLSDARARLSHANTSDTGDSSEHELGGLTFKNIIGDVSTLILDASNAGNVFQAASQFNVLEMMSPEVTPDKGITCYFRDRTQGPISAMACPAGTAFRNYYLTGSSSSSSSSSTVGVGLGQGGSFGGSQVNTLHAVEDLLFNVEGGKLGDRYWNVENGFCIPLQKDSLPSLNLRLAVEVDAGDAEGGLEGAVSALSVSGASESALACQVRDLVEQGVHWDTEVAQPKKWKKVSASVAAGGGGGGTGGFFEDTSQSSHRVCQVYSSGCPVAYTRSVSTTADWEKFATLILESAFECTLAVGSILARERGERVKVFLTGVGGGVFGNGASWIMRSILRALKIHLHESIDVILVNYGVITDMNRQIETSIAAHMFKQSKQSEGPKL